MATTPGKQFDGVIDYNAIPEDMKPCEIFGGRKSSPLHVELWKKVDTQYCEHKFVNLSFNCNYF